VDAGADAERGLGVDVVARRAEVLAAQLVDARAELALAEARGEPGDERVEVLQREITLGVFGERVELGGAERDRGVVAERERVVQLVGREARRLRHQVAEVELLAVFVEVAQRAEIVVVVVDRVRGGASRDEDEGGETENAALHGSATLERAPG
jgi:hypothetical protein